MYIKLKHTQILVDDQLDAQLLRRRWTQSNSGSITALKRPCDPQDWPQRVHLAWFIIGKPNKGYCVWHKNSDRSDYRAVNIEWRKWSQVIQWHRQQHRAEQQFKAIAIPQAEHKQ